MNHQLVPVADIHLDTIHDLVNRTYRADEVPTTMSRDELVDLLNGPHTTSADDARVILADGQAVGYLIVHFRPSGQRQERTFLMGAVDNEHRRRGIGSALLEWGLDRSRERLRLIDNDLPRAVQAETYSWQADRLALFAKFGMTPARYYHEMLRTLESLPRVETNGFELQPWAPEHSDEARLVFNDSFMDHWGSTPVDEQTWRHWLGESGTRLDLSFIAMAEGKMIGLSLNEHYPADETLHGRKEGWISALGTLRDHRGMGVASALLAASFRAFAGQGFTHAALGVDTKSPTKADRLYSNLGFATDRMTILVERRLDSEA